MLSFVMASSILLESMILSSSSVIKIGIVVFLLIISSGKSKSEFSLALATLVGHLKFHFYSLFVFENLEKVIGIPKYQTTMKKKL